MMHVVELFAHETRASLACIFNDIAADDLALQDARVWQAAMVQDFFIWVGWCDIIQPSICISDLCDANRTKFPGTKMPDTCIWCQNCPKRLKTSAVLFWVRFHGKLMSESQKTFVYPKVMQWCEKKCMSTPALHVKSLQTGWQIVNMSFDLFLKHSLPGLQCCNNVATDLDVAMMFEAVLRIMGSQTNALQYSHEIITGRILKYIIIQWLFFHFITDKI